MAGRPSVLLGSVAAAQHSAARFTGLAWSRKRLASARPQGVSGSAEGGQDPQK